MDLILTLGSTGANLILTLGSTGATLSGIALFRLSSSRLGTGGHP